MHDLVIRHGVVVDGTGRPRFEADIAVDDGKISVVGKVADTGREEIDAADMLVTPGFVDTHTHYDGQITWDPLLTSSCWHGVTTVTMGNCGVGFAPAAPGRHDWLIGLMEGVEDIPGSVLSEGMVWGWETFPQYLDFLDRLPKALDVATQVPHGPVRAYVMGERGANNDPATPADIQKMADIVEEAIAAGALGFTTSRTVVHKTSDGRAVPGTYAEEAEIFGIGERLRQQGRGLFEVVQAGAVGEGEDPASVTRRELDWMCRLSSETGRPVVFALVQNNRYPGTWREALDLTEQAQAKGVQLHAMTAARAIGSLLGLQSLGEPYSPIAYFNPFRFRPSFKALVGLPLDELVRELRDPDRKRRILSETPEYPDRELADAVNADDPKLNRFFSIDDDADYEPNVTDSILERARRSGRDPYEYFYDALLELGGRRLFLYPVLNYSDGNENALREMLISPASVVGLGDGGAHCQNICDSSYTTYMLTHWVRDRSRGLRVPLEWAVRKMTLDTASLWGMHDRGVLAPGKKADLNVIDFDRLRIHRPDFVHDLPANGSRIIQKSEGYVATVNSGQIVMRNGEETGLRPGRLVRAR